MADGDPFFFGDMFAQPTDCPGFEWITVVSGAMFEQFAQKFDIFIRDKFGSAHRIL
jgi:hypothetical protein